MTGGRMRGKNVNVHMLVCSPITGDKPRGLACKVQFGLPFRAILVRISKSMQWVGLEKQDRSVAMSNLLSRLHVLLLLGACTLWPVRVWAQAENKDDEE